MKKTILTFVVFAFIANVPAQIKVNSSGQVGIGADPQDYKLQVAGDAYVSGNIYLGEDTASIGTAGNFPLVFKLNNTVAGFISNEDDYYSPANTSFGYGALSNNPINGFANVAVGFEALRVNMAEENTAIGYQALYNSTIGLNNTATGTYTLRSNTTGGGNTANGAYALYRNTSGDANVANGALSLNGNTTGMCNTAIGTYALLNNTTGSFNTALGSSSGVSSGNGTFNNTTALGYGATVTASNQVRIGNSSVTSIGGQVAWTNLSDGRVKQNIRANVPGLDFINRLQPVTYNLNLDAVDGLMKTDENEENTGSKFKKQLPPELEEINRKARETQEKRVHTGFIAQDVEKTAQSIAYDFSGVDVDEMGVYGLRYSEFVVPLVKAVQELSEQNSRLQKQLDDLSAWVHQMSGKENNPDLLKKGGNDIPETEWDGTAAGGAALEQNVPNPFNQAARIRYALPEAYSSARMVMVDTAGKVIRLIPLSGSGTNSLTIDGGSLLPGVYYYSLYVDGHWVDTKKMIVTEK